MNDDALLRRFVRRVISESPRSQDSIVFQHQSSEFHDKLRPVTYDEIAARRENDEYMRDRKRTEKKYHEMLPTSDPKRSFLYASVVGSNMMEDPLTFPGFTYFFRLTTKQIENTIFEVVDRKRKMQPKVGASGLEKALSFWEENLGSFAAYDDDVVGGEIRPRVEVVIPYEISYFDFVPQVEDR